jgi:hypothetical protein
MLASSALETADLADPHQVVQLLARVGEVLADMVVDFHAALGQFGFHAPVSPAARNRRNWCRPWCRPSVGHGGYRVGHCAAQICALADIVAGADLCALSGRASGASPGLTALPSLDGQNQEFRIGRQRDAVERHLQQRAVIVGIAHQHGAQQLLAVFADDDFL